MKVVLKYSFPVVVVILSLWLVLDNKPNQIDLNKYSGVGGFENPAARKQLEFMMTRNPVTNKVPSNIKLKETRFTENITAREKSKFSTITSLQYEWKQVGPINVGGRTRALEMDIANNDILIAGGVSGGVFKSTNRGDSWYRVSPKSSVYGVTALAQDKREGFENNWYYGSGEYTGNSAAADGAIYYGGGLYHSSDNGETWELIPATVTENITEFDTPFKYVFNLKVYPGNTDNTQLYVAASTGLYRLTSDGDDYNIEAVLGDIDNDSPAFTDIDISDNGVIYAALSPESFAMMNVANSWGIYRSEDGVNWQDITPVDMTEQTRRIVLDIYEADDNIVYALAETPGAGSTGHSLWRIEYDQEGSSSFNNLTSAIPDTNWGDPFDSQGSYNLVVSVKPDDENIVFIGGTNLYRSTDGFKSLESVEIVAGYGEEDVIPGSWVDQHKIIYAYDNTNEIFIGNDGGVRRSPDCSADEIFWEDKNLQYITSQFYSIDLVEEIEGSAFMLGGLQDRDVWISDEFDFNKPWQTINIGADGSYCEFTKDVFPLYVSAQNASIIRVNELGPLDESNAALISPDLGASVLFINPFALDPNDQNVMYVASANGIWRNSDLSGIPTGNQEPTDINWELIESTEVNSIITALGTSRSPAHILYYGTYDGEVFKLDNSNESFDDPVDITGQLFPEGYVSSIYVDPDNADNIIISFSNYGVISIYASDDGGESWEAVAGNLEEYPDGSGNGPSVRWVSAVKVDTTFICFAGTSTGLYSTSEFDGMNTEWVKEGENVIGNSVVSMIKTRNSDGTVLLSTHGSGVYYTQIEDGITSVENENLDKKFELAQNYPNPFNPSTTIKYSVPGASHVELTVYDLIGREVAQLVNETKSAGSYEVKFDASDLASGTYVYRLKTGNYSTSKKMLLVK